MKSELHYKDRSDQNNVLFYKLSIWVIIGIGVFIRLFHFFYNRSLWEDEIYLSAGILHHSFKETLTQTLPYLQKAPPGYLLFARLGVAILGNNEMGLRLYSLLCGIATLFAFLPLTKRFLKPIGQVIAMALLAFAQPLVYHTVEAKPYIAEVLATIIITLWYLKYRYETDLRKLTIWGIKGAVIVWFCYPSLFILAASGVVAFIHQVKKKNWKIALFLAVPGLMWLISFGISYILYTKQGSDSEWLVVYWTKIMNGYMPLRPVGAMVWLCQHLFSAFDNTMGLSWIYDWREHSAMKIIVTRMAYVPLALFIAGLIYLYKYNKALLLFLGIVFLIAITASALVLYPMNERLMMYLTPFVALILAGGAQLFVQSNLLMRGLGYILIATIIILSLKNSMSAVINPDIFGGTKKKSFQREALSYLNEHYVTGDIVYVYRNDLPGYTLYKTIYPYKFNAILGHDYRLQAKSFDQYFSMLNNDFLPFYGKKRVWIIYSTTIDIPVGETEEQSAWYYDKGEGVKLFQNWLSSRSVIKAEYHPASDNVMSDVRVCLMDFSKAH